MICYEFGCNANNKLAVKNTTPVTRVIKFKPNLMQDPMANFPLIYSDVGETLSR